MAPLPDSSTARFWMDYTVAGSPHSLMVRFTEPTAAPADVADVLASVLGFVEGSLADSFVVTGARVAAVNEEFSLPFSLVGTDLAGFTGAGGTIPANEEPRELVYVGRSQVSGRRSRFSLYGALITTPGNYRLGPGETAFANSAVFAALNSAGSIGIFLAIDGTISLWYSYVNVNYNSYWETQARN
jgi:hypothetical protein